MLLNYQKNTIKQNQASSMNPDLINELINTLLHYLEEKEIVKLQLDVISLDRTDKELILKKLTPYNTKIVTISNCLESWIAKNITKNNG